MASIWDTLFGSPDEDRRAEGALDDGDAAIAGLDDLVLGRVDPVSGRVIDQADVEGYDAATIDGVPDVVARGYDPAMVARTAFDDVQVDPRLRQAQLDALAQMQDVASQGGLTAQDRARIAQIQSDTATADRGRREAILNNMRARGMGGSSQELLAALQSAQAATDQESQQSLGVAGMAQQRALDAMQQAGRLGGQIRGQDFGEQGAVAESRDRINQFNATNTNAARQFRASALNEMGNANANRALGAQTFNAGSMNDARQFGASSRNAAAMDYTGRAQGVSDAFTGARNDAERINKIEAPSRVWDAKANKAGMRVNQAGSRANYWNNRGDRTAQTKAGLWDGAIKLGTAAVPLLSDGEKKSEKKKVTVDDLKEFLDAVKPKTFKYKDPSEEGALSGERVGFIAQDVKDTELGKDLISERSDGSLQYDPENLQGIILAALKEIGVGKKGGAA